MSNIKKRLQPNWTPSLEMFAFQGDEFFKELTQAFTELAAVPGIVTTERFFDSPPARSIRDIVRKHTGLLISFQEGKCQASLPMIDKNSIFLSEEEREWAKVLEEEGGYFDEETGVIQEPQDFECDVREMMHILGKRILNGTVDLKLGRVGGIYSEMPCRVWHSRRCIYGRFGWTPAHNAAILLHEIGHLMTGFAVAGRQVTTNQHLAVISRVVDGSTNYSQRETVFAMIKDQYGLTKDQIHAMASAKSGKQACIILLDQAYRTIDSELGSSAYDQVSVEAVADAYAIRCGAGRFLAEADSNRKEIYQPTSGFKMAAGFWSFFLGGMIFLVGGGPALLIFLTMITTLGLGAYSIRSTDVEDYKNRLIRIKNEMTEIIKDSEISVSQRDCILADVRALSGMIAAIKIEPTLGQRIAKFLNIKVKTKQSYSDLQIELESLASNRLFVSAAQLRTV